MKKVEEIRKADEEHERMMAETTRMKEAQRVKMAQEMTKARKKDEEYARLMEEARKTEEEEMKKVEELRKADEDHRRVTAETQRMKADRERLGDRARIEAEQRKNICEAQERVWIIQAARKLQEEKTKRKADDAKKLALEELKKLQEARQTEETRAMQLKEARLMEEKALQKLAQDRKAADDAQTSKKAADKAQRVQDAAEGSGGAGRMDMSEEHHLKVALEISARAAGLEARDPTLLHERWMAFLQTLAKGPNPLETPPAKLSLRSPCPTPTAIPGTGSPTELDLNNKAAGALQLIVSSCALAEVAEACSCVRMLHE